MCKRCALPRNSAACTFTGNPCLSCRRLQRFPIHARRAGGLADPRCRQHVSDLPATKPGYMPGGRAARETGGQADSSREASRQPGRLPAYVRDSSLCVLQHFCELVLCCRFIEVYHWIRSHHPYWDRNGGRDHMLVREERGAAGRQACVVLRLRARPPAHPPPPACRGSQNCVCLRML
jgi:hypothetical protein